MDAKMAAEVPNTRRRARLRQLAITCVFIVGTVAIAATSPARTTVNVPVTASSVQLDGDHPTALSRFVVRVNAEASSGHPRNNIKVKLNAAKRAGEGSTALSAAGDVRVIVTTATPGAFPTPLASEPSTGPRPTPWEAPLSVG